MLLASGTRRPLALAAGRAARPRPPALMPPSPLSRPARSFCPLQRRALSSGTVPGGALRRGWAAYCGQLQRRPLPVKLASAVAIFATGDIATQTVFEGVALAEVGQCASAILAAFSSTTEAPLWLLKVPLSLWDCPRIQVDVRRAARLACFGVVVTAYVHTWWGFLEPRAALVFCPTVRARRAAVATHSSRKPLP
jgi:hypothetical protein